MTKLTKKAIRYGRTDGHTDPNYRKASLLKIVLGDPLKSKKGPRKLRDNRYKKNMVAKHSQNPIILICHK